ncbi:DUF3515 family protein [Pseudofrankia sp. DC12]|uniref:DUF3515 family protein n=1 Tax=Pseudofrankia sp. DC12 TaxID=683315 RepID=UPI000AEB71BB|nr:DUF3515 family protein [Pseudofrankia sp. DC12]
MPALLVIALCGCGGGSGPVQVTGAPTPTGAAAASCRALLAALPDSLGKGLDRREVSPPGVFAAAYGKAPVVLTCGADGVPATYQKTSDVAQVNDVSWFSEDASGRTRLSTPTRRPQVTMLLPGDAQPWDLLVAVASAVRAHTTSTVPETPAP